VLAVDAQEGSSGVLRRIRLVAVIDVLGLRPLVRELTVAPVFTLILNMVVKSELLRIVLVIRALP